MAHETALSLIPLVVSPADISRLHREVKALDDYLYQASLREGGESSRKLPRTSRLLESLSETNGLNLLHEPDRKRLNDFLDDIFNNAPTIHISFASDPSSAFIGKIIDWLRNNIHPGLLLSTGLQPGIAAGCVVRTPNRVYDFSLRRQFEDKRPLLKQKLKGSPQPDTAAAIDAQPSDPGQEVGANER